MTGAYNAVFNSILRTSKRTSMIIRSAGWENSSFDCGSPATRGRWAGGGGRVAGAGAAPGAVAVAGTQNDNPGNDGAIAHAVSVYKCRSFRLTRPLLRAP